MTIGKTCVLAVSLMAAATRLSAIPTTVSVASSANPSVLGQTVTLTATISGGGGTPTGTASFFDGVVLLGVVPLSGSAAVFSSSAFTVGSHLITVIYNGDINFDPSAGGLTQVVAKAATVTTVSVTPGSSTVGQAVTLTGTVTSAYPGTPTGTVSFFDGATLLGSATLAGGSATLSTSSLSLGTHTITAVYSSDSTFAASTSVAVTQTVAAVTVPTVSTWALVVLGVLLAAVSAVMSRRAYRQA